MPCKPLRKLKLPLVTWAPGSLDELPHPSIFATSS